MRKYFNQFIFGICIVSWPLFFIFFALYFFPVQTIRGLDQSISSYAVEYSELENTGSIFNPILSFVNIRVSNKLGKVFEAEKFADAFTQIN